MAEQRRAPSHKVGLGRPWLRLAAILLGILVVALLFAYGPMVVWLLEPPRTILIEEHTAPDFTLRVTEKDFLGPNHVVHARPKGAFRGRDVATVFAGDWFDTPNIDGDSLRFEWHDDRRLVTLRGSEMWGQGADLHLVLLSFDGSGNVTEVPIDVEVPDGLGDLWGRHVRQARHAEISRILGE